MCTGYLRERRLLTHVGYFIITIQFANTIILLVVEYLLVMGKLPLACAEHRPWIGVVT